MEILEHCRETGRPLLVRYPNGTLGHFQRREDDCMRAAVASILNCTTIDVVPDAPYDARIAAGGSQDVIVQEAGAELVAWLAGRGLRMTIRRPPPWSHVRWLGVSLDPDPANNHVVVMRGRRVYHDPAQGFPVPAGHKVAPVARIDYGITFDPMEDTHARTA